MSQKMYGVADDSTKKCKWSDTIEALTIRGYSVIPNVLDSQQLEATRKRLDSVYMKQEEELGKELLASIDELDTARCPLAYDEFFIDLARNSTIVDIAQEAIGGRYVILHLQNGILNRPNQRHHQTAWHRDLPYQHFVSSRPLALSALYCIDDFTEETGGTYVLPHSHRFEQMPSAAYCEKYETVVVSLAGSVIIIDSMLYHRAGFNRSKRIRRAINHVYTIPILKQQINLSGVLKNKQDDGFLRQLLDCEGDAPASVVEYRHRRHRKLQRA